MAENEQLVTIDADGALSLADRPARVIEQAREVAAAVMTIINSKKNPVVFNNEKYFENEDWVLAGKMYGITVRVVKDEYVEFGEVKGFQAEAEAYLVSTGQVIGHAFSMCLNDEENWGVRPKYEWVEELDENGKKIWEERTIKGVKKKLPRAKKVQTGATKVPLFQLRSMAQTRASSKVLSMLLKFVPVLAGFKPTPAEEVNENDADFFGAPEENEDRPTRAKRKQQKDAAPAEEKAAPVQDPLCITPEQKRNLWIASTKAGYSEEDIRAEFKANYKDKNGKPLEHTADMLKGDFMRYMESLPKKKSGGEPEQDELGANG